MIKISGTHEGDGKDGALPNKLLYNYLPSKFSTVDDSCNTGWVKLFLEVLDRENLSGLVLFYPLCTQDREQQDEAGFEPRTSCTASDPSGEVTASQLHT